MKREGWAVEAAAFFGTDQAQAWRIFCIYLHILGQKVFSFEARRVLRLETDNSSHEAWNQFPVAACNITALSGDLSVFSSVSDCRDITHQS